jgi:hypothetical protein
VKRRGEGIDSHGRTWVARVVAKREAAAEDFRFWYEDLTPEGRVATVAECLLSSLKTRGLDELPRLRRVSRVVKRPRR